MARAPVAARRPLPPRGRTAHAAAYVLPDDIGFGYPYEARIGLPRWTAYAQGRWQAAAQEERWSAELLTTA